MYLWENTTNNCFLAKTDYNYRTKHIKMQLGLTVCRALKFKQFSSTLGNSDKIQTFRMRLKLC